MSDMTKWQILESRVGWLTQEAAKINRELRGMMRTPFGQPCGGCGVMLETEADFAKHFLVNDVRFLNLGRCPNPAQQSSDALPPAR